MRKCIVCLESTGSDRAFYCKTHRDQQKKLGLSLKLHRSIPQIDQSLPIARTVYGSGVERVRPT